MFVGDEEVVGGDEVGSVGDEVGEDVAVGCIQLRDRFVGVVVVMRFCFCWLLWEKMRSCVLLCVCRAC